MREGGMMTACIRLGLQLVLPTDIASKGCKNLGGWCLWGNSAFLFQWRTCRAVRVVCFLVKRDMLPLHRLFRDMLVMKLPLMRTLYSELRHWHMLIDFPGADRARKRLWLLLQVKVLLFLMGIAY